MNPWKLVKVGLGVLVYGAVAARDRYRDVKAEQQRRLRALEEAQKAAKRPERP